MTRGIDQAGAAVSAHVRVGDQERADAAGRLAAHAAAGRLSVDELETRVERAHAAVFSDELALLEADLPAARRQSRPALRPAPRLVLVLVLATAVAAAALASATVGHPIFLPFVAALLLWRFGVLRVRRSQT
jgi:DUF1707 SHOCT-like domain